MTASQAARRISSRRATASPAGARDQPSAPRALSRVGCTRFLRARPRIERATCRPVKSAISLVERPGRAERRSMVTTSAASRPSSRPHVRSTASITARPCFRAIHVLMSWLSHEGLTDHCSPRQTHERPQRGTRGWSYALVRPPPKCSAPSPRAMPRPRWSQPRWHVTASRAEPLGLRHGSRRQRPGRRLLAEGDRRPAPALRRPTTRRHCPGVRLARCVDLAEGRLPLARRSRLAGLVRRRDPEIATTEHLTRPGGAWSPVTSGPRFLEETPPGQVKVLKVTPRGLEHA